MRFSGYCRKCNTYGHKAIDCRVVPRVEGVPTKNRFAALEEKSVECFRCGKQGHVARKCMEDIHVECYRCGRYGHIAKDCTQRVKVQCYRYHKYGHVAKDCLTVLPGQKKQRKKAPQSPAENTVVQQSAIAAEKQKVPKAPTVADKAEWRIKRKSLLVQTTLKARSKEASWILDSGCTSQMTGDKSRLQNVNTFNGGSVRFGNNDGAKIVGKGSLSLNEGKIRCNNIFYGMGSSTIC